MKQLIRKILKEESLKQTLLDQIKQDGWLETAELVGGPENLINLIGEDSIMDMLISCFKDLHIENRGGNVYLMDGGLPILEKKSSFWGLSLIAYHGYITSRLNQYLSFDIIIDVARFQKNIRRDLIRELVKRFPELYVEDVDVYLDSGLYDKIDSFSLDFKNLNEGVSRDWMDSEYADEYDTYKDLFIDIIKDEIKSYGQDENKILLGDSNRNILIDYRKKTKELWYDYSFDDFISTYIPWHIYNRHFKYALSDFFEKLFPEFEVKSVKGANIHYY